MTPKKDHALGLEKVSRLLPDAKVRVLCNAKQEQPLTKSVIASHWSNVFEILEDFV